MGDWAILLAAWQLFVYQPAPLSLFVAVCLMSWGQRGISNLAHDSIHRNLFANKVILPIE